LICAACVIGIVFLWARSQDFAPDETAKAVKSLTDKVNKIEAATTAGDSLADVQKKLDTAMVNTSMLRLEVESLKSQIAFPQKQEVLLKQEKTWEVHLVPDRPVVRKKKVPAAYEIDLPVGRGNKVQK